MAEVEDRAEASTSSAIKTIKKPPKRGIIYLSSIPATYNVTRIRETFGQYGKIGKVRLQFPTKRGKKPKKKEKNDSVNRNGKGTQNKRRKHLKFTEGWVEFERKSTAKRVAAMLNNTPVSNSKTSGLYDVTWNIKYLKHFKWHHLHDRLAYEKADYKHRLNQEIILAKKKTDYFNKNLSEYSMQHNQLNREFMDVNNDIGETPNEPEVDRRKDFLQSLFE